MELVAIIAFLVVAAVIVAIQWPHFTRDRRGSALAVSIAALAAFVCAGVAQGADAPRPWPLIGLLVGLGLLVTAEYLAARQKSSSSDPESRLPLRDDIA
jgi:hypothetical protein